MCYAICEELLKKKVRMFPLLPGNAISLGLRAVCHALSRSLTSGAELFSGAKVGRRP